MTIKNKKELDKFIKTILEKYNPAFTYNITMKKVTARSKAPQWFVEFKKENDERWERQEKFNERQQKFNERQEEFNKAILKEARNHGWKI